MAKKPIIAVDIDDVLAISAAGWVAYSNQKWGTNLTPEDYDEDWPKMWKVDLAEGQERAKHIHTTSGIVTAFEHDQTARKVLDHLSERFELVITTSRHKLLNHETLTWIDQHFNGVFTNIHFAGIFDSGHKDPINMTKADLIESVNADYLIDDQPKHCFAVAKRGKQAILFGEYTWNKDVEVVPGVTRCLDWAAVQEYFDGQG
ncbi:hypothetical protein BH09PAT3_BH09PAT3_6230 [soil metagenome]